MITWTRNRRGSYQAESARMVYRVYWLGKAAWEFSMRDKATGHTSTFGPFRTMAEAKAQVN